MRAWGQAGEPIWLNILFAVLGIGALMGAASAIQRALLAGRAGGSGMVVVEEGRITYFGPFGGTAMAIDLLVRVELATTDDPRTPPIWELTDADARKLLIPAGATGSEKLGDVLAQLSGFDQIGLIRGMQRRQTGVIRLWQRPVKEVAALHLPD